MSKQDSTKIHLTTQTQQTQLATILVEHRQTMSDAEWLDYYSEIGFPVSVREETDEERILAAVQFDAAESGLLPDWFYESEKASE